MENVKKQFGVFLAVMGEALRKGTPAFALLFTIIVLLFGVLMAMGFYEPHEIYANLRGLYDNFFGKILIFVFLTFSLWHSTTRLYQTAKNFGVGLPKWLLVCIFGAAIVGTVMIAKYLV